MAMMMMMMTIRVNVKFSSTKVIKNYAETRLLTIGVMMVRV